MGKAARDLPFPLTHDDVVFVLAYTIGGMKCSCQGPFAFLYRAAPKVSRSFSMTSGSISSLENSLLTAYPWSDVMTSFLPCRSLFTNFQNPSF